MKIYLIKHEVHNYDAYMGFVIVANYPYEVRDMAARNHGDEGADIWYAIDVEECGTYAGDRTEPFILLSDYNAG